jgi:hypothetical protein
MFRHFMSRRPAFIMIVFSAAIMVSIPFGLPAQVASVQITRTPQGAPVPSDFVGISIENDIGQTYFGTMSAPNTVFLQLLKNLGSSGSLRIGGNSGDLSCWAGQAAPNPAICDYQLTSADFASWTMASAQTGWPMLIGVSLAQAESPGAPQYIVNEITQGLLPVLQQHTKAKLLGIELGNEINLYYLNPAFRPSTYSVANQVSDLQSYVSALKSNSSTKGLTLTVPAYYDPSVNTIQQGVDVIVQDLTKCAKCVPSNVGLVTLHEYPLSLYKGEVPTIAQLLSNTIDTNTESIFSRAVSDATSKFGLSVQLDESGNVSVDPGQPGVSNVQAAVLWELDFGLDMARLGIRRANFHIHDGSYYIPIQVNSTGAGSYQVQVMPSYYSLYALSAAKGQEFLPVTTTTSANIRAYALSTCPTCPITVYLINKDLTESGSVQIGLSAPATNATYFEIAAPALSSMVQDITYGGVQFSNATGQLTGPVQTQTIQPDVNGNYTVTLDNAAAGILTIQP